MAGIQQQQLVNDTLPASWNGSSNRIASVNVEEGQPQPWVDDLDLEDPNHQVSFIYVQGN
jgi:natural resistance-associated macrophage protein